MKTPIRIDSNRPGPALLVTAGVHGDEYEPIMAAHQLARSLGGLLVKGSVTAVPYVNSTAVAARQRCGSDGLDLARVCPGDANGSPTMKDAAAVSGWIAKSDCLIDLHTGGRIFDIFPMAGYMVHPDPGILELQRRMAVAFGMPLIWATDPAPNGRTLSVARDAGIPSLYAEYGGGSTVRESIVNAYVKGCLGVMSMLGMTNVPAPDDSHLKYWIEDATPNKGHLQSKTPSPADGVFKPAVQLGERVSRGDLWGHVFDLDTGDAKVVEAEDTGLVLFLRADAVVKAGDSLGGIVSVNESTVKMMR